MSDERKNAVPYGPYAECPHCKGKYWITVDRTRNIKIHRCLDCKKEYTVLISENLILPGNILHLPGVFRAKCPQCKSHEWTTTERSGDGKRDYKCALCQQWYRVDFKKKKITMRP